jgi:hypothetical protein
MARSAAKKNRIKLEREGRRNPELNRQTWGGFNPLERKPERPEIEQRRRENKYGSKRNRYSRDGDSCYA